MNEKKRFAVSSKGTALHLVTCLEIQTILQDGLAGSRFIRRLNRREAAAWLGEFKSRKTCRRCRPVILEMAG